MSVRVFANDNNSVNSFSLGLAAQPWIAALVIAAAFAFAVWTYHRTSPPARPARRWLLIALRTIGIALLLFTIFEPVIDMLAVNAEDPEVVVIIDDSGSMGLAGLDSVRIAEARAIAGSIAASKLGAHARFLTVSDSVRPLPGPAALARLVPRDRQTRLEAPFAGIADSLRRSNIRAIVLISDGRYTDGPNPLFSAEGLGIPVFAVGMGDSTPPKDLAIQELFTNEVAYVGTDLPVEVRASSAGYAQGTAAITLRDDNGIIATQTVTLASGGGDYVASFVYRPRSEGLAKLRAEIAGAGGEVTTRNNSRTTFVKVKSDKRRYLLIAGGPNPDVAFLRRLLSADRSVEVKTFIGKGNGEFIEGALGAAAFRDAEAVALVDFPTASTTPEAIRLVRDAVQTANLPLFVVMGANTDIGRLRQLEALLPVTFGDTRSEEMQVFADLTDNGQSNPVTHVRQMDAWKSLPPIYRSETSAHARAESEVLATARLGSAQLGDPLIVARRIGRARSLMVLGYGIYRWQLLGEGPVEARGEQGSSLLADFIGNGLRWLAAGDNDRQVRIVASKPIYSLGEPARLLAQVYDESYNPLSDAVVNVAVTGPGGRIPISLAPLGNGRYEGTLGNLSAGDYSFTGTATSGGRELGRDAGRFEVGDVGIEFQEPSMNADLLRALASRTGGRFYTSRSSRSLIDEIAAHKGFAPRSVESHEETPLWQRPWLLLAALASFAIEWVIRKRSGML